MDSAQEAGYEKLIVAGEPLSKKEQNELKNTKVINDVQNEPVANTVEKRRSTEDYASRIPRDEEWID